MPTSAGVETIACVAPAAVSGAFKSDCDAIADTLEVTDGEPLPVGPSKDYADAVGKALGDLGGAVKAGEAKLRAAKTPKAQGAAARSLSGAYDTAAKALAGLELGPADRGPNSALVSALEDASAAYGRAASAATKKDKAGFRRAGREIDEAERALAVAFDGLKAAGYGVAS